MGFDLAVFMHTSFHGFTFQADLFGRPGGPISFTMKDSTKRAMKREEVAEKSIQQEPDDMVEIKLFIRKKQLQNIVLKKLSAELDLKSTQDEEQQPEQISS